MDLGGQFITAYYYQGQWLFQ